MDKSEMSPLEENTEGYTAIPIERMVLDRIKSYAEIAKRVEIYGFLLTPADKNDGIIRRAILAKNQEVSGSHAKVSGEDVAKCDEEIENLGYIKLGFWHSHASFSAFHSGTDDRNMDNLFMSFVGNSSVRKCTDEQVTFKPDYKNQRLLYRHNGVEYRFGLSNWGSSIDIRPVEEEYFKFPGEKGFVPFIIIGQDKDTDEIRLILRDESGRVMAREPREFTSSNIKAKNVRTIGVGYSIVTNNQGDLYGEIAVNKWCSTCERDETPIVKNAKFKIIGDGGFSYKREDLVRDLEERVKGFKREKSGTWY